MEPTVSPPHSPYAERIAHLVDVHVRHASRGLPFLPLLKELGCRYMDEIGNSYRIRTPRQPEPVDEPLVCQTLLITLSSYVRNGFLENGDGFCLINGLYDHSRWRQCLSNAEDAYGLAALCASLTADELPLDRQTGGGMEMPRVCLLLNEWLQPAEPFTEPPLIPALSRLLFGDAWYSFNIEMAGEPNWRVPFVIYKTRPPFMPGVVNFILEDSAHELPSLASL
jgi:hypothetical protein